MRISETDTLNLTVKGQRPHPTKLDVKNQFAFEANFITMTRSELEAFVEAGNTVRALLDKVLISVTAVGGKPIEDREGNALDPDRALELIKENTFTSTAARDAFWAATQSGKK